MDAAVLQIWREVVVSAGDWRPVPEIPSRPGLFGGCWVRCRQTQRLAWMKPAENGPGTKRAAREKIAFDLAHELGINVPPVLLLRHPMNGADKEPLLACLSLVCRPKQDELSDRLPPESKPSEAQLEFFASLLDSRVLAFDAWLGNTDRQHNPRNILIGHGDGPPELLYLDFSEGMRWTEANQVAIDRVNFPEPLNQLVNPDEIRRGCREICAIDRALIESVVERIPDDFLPAEARELLLSGLIARRGLLEAAVDTWYPGE